MIKIPIYDINNQGKTFAGTISSEELSLNIKGLSVNDISYSIKVSLVSTNILLQGNINCIIKETCVKCLETFDLKLENYEICHYYEEMKENELDISNDIRDDILLKLEDHPICSKDCQGLCSSCGINLNKKDCVCNNEPINNVWGALDNLK